MKVYAINLERAVERRKHIIRQLEKRRLDYELIDAVDGEKLTDEELKRLCDMEEAKKRPHKLTVGALGCALSHLKAYEKMLADGEEIALILEDDAVLPKGIDKILEQVEKNIGGREAILLHYFRILPERPILSSYGATALSDSHRLLYPVNFPMSGTAYVIKANTARALIRIKLPIKAEADDWGHFFEQGAIESLRCIYPKAVEVTYAETQVQIQYTYDDLPKMRQKLVKFVYDNKVPILFQMYLKYVTLKERYKPLTVLTDEPSALLEKASAAQPTSAKVSAASADG